MKMTIQNLVETHVEHNPKIKMSPLNSTQGSPHQYQIMTSDYVEKDQ